MLSLMETSPELLAAIFVGACTVSAAVVQSVAQVKVAREARRNAKPAPHASRRVTRWLLVGAALALGLGWSATITPGQAHGEDGSRFIGSGVTAVLGPRGEARGDAPPNASTVALLHLARPLTERQAIALLRAHDLRAYAIDLRLAGEPAAWRAIPIGFAPDESLPYARRAALRQAWQDACALETIAAQLDADVAASPAPGMEGQLVSDDLTNEAAAAQLDGERAAVARLYAQRLAADSAVIHALRVIGSVSAATRASQDSTVERAEIMRYDTGWSGRDSAPHADAACDVVVLAAD